MKKIISITSALLIAGCAGTPPSIEYNKEIVGTYSTTAGCGTLSLDQDCSQMSGATRNIRIKDRDLRIAGSEDGKIVLVMSKPKFLPDEEVLKEGSQEIEKIFESRGLGILSTKVIYGSGKVFGVHYTLDGDGYSNLKQLSVSK